MKLSKILMAFFCTFCIAFAAQAQVNRSIAPQQYKRNNNGNKGEKKDIVEQITEGFTKQLSLDAFQAAAAKQIVEGQRNAITQLGEERDITPAERNDRYLAIFENIEKKLLPILTEEQAEKLKQMKEKKG